jgi:DNA-binding NtrC family response regulator
MHEWQLTRALRVLHLDDDPFERENLAFALAPHPEQFALTSVATAVALRDALAAAPDLVVLDIQLGGTETGISLLPHVREAVPEAVVLMCSAADAARTVAQCLELGADDFLSKRFDRTELPSRLLHIYRLAALKRGLALPGGNPAPAPARYAGDTIERLARRIPQLIASAVSSVYLEGESGTGKEVVADLFCSALEPGTPFVRVNCAAIAPALLESELFGHVKGAFTGAMGDKRGLLEAASGGWIFLDEVASLSLSAQAALLRALENRELRRVGSVHPVRLELRVLSATNTGLSRLVREGGFRADLWQRLRESEIVLPPLRERREEIPALVSYFCQQMPGGPYQMTETARRVLTQLDWRGGNVRELRNCLRAMTEFQADKRLTPLSLPSWVWKALREPRPPRSLSVPLHPGEEWNFDRLSGALLLEVTREVAKSRGPLSLRALSRALGLSRSTLTSRLRRLARDHQVESRELCRLLACPPKQWA